MQNVNIKMQNFPSLSLRFARRRLRNFPFLLFLVTLVVVFSILIPHEVLAWDLSTASYDSVSFGVTGQDTNPHGVTFKSDGTKMYVVGITNDTVYQYSLSSAWDLSTASYESVSFSVAGQDVAPVAITFKSDGTKMYMVGQTNDAVYQYSLSSAWNISTASYDSVSFSVAGQESASTGINFKSDGMKMYVVGSTSDRVRQYSLSSAWDLSTASYETTSTSLTGQDSFSQDIFFKSDGTKMYMVGSTNDTVYQYSLSSAWDASTVSYDSVSFSVAGQDTVPTGIAFKNDGTKMYVLGTTNDTVYQYSLTSSNTAPTISAGPSDGGSYSGAPTNVGSNVTFTATATDTESNTYYLAICKTNSVTAVNSSAPTCPGGSWAISSSTASGAQASVTYTTQSSDSSTNAWYAFVCDNNSASACSASSQGSGNNGSPFAVNHVPTFTSISNTSGYIKSGSTVTFTSVASDSDGSDTITLYICKANDFTGTACGAGGTWAYSSATTTNPTATYTVQSSDTDGSHTYYANIIDNNSAAATANPRSGSFTTDSTSPTINSGSDQTKTAIFTTEATASDATSGIASYLWTKQSGSGDVVFGTSTTLNTTISATDGTYIIRLTVTDTASNSSYDEFTLIRTVSSPAGTATTSTGYGGRAIPISSSSSHAIPFTFTLPYLFSRYLGPGDKGEDVLKLQQLLQATGFFPTTITPNGVFGPATKASVRRFQQSRQISQTGNVGPLTQRALNILQLERGIQELQKQINLIIK